MPSTYSTNLGLELPADGDQAGVWGQTVNRNIGTLLEQAISGYATVAITDGADTTITMPDGATGVARNMVLQLYGTLTAERNLIVPNKKKLYLFGNACNYAVTAKPSGGTGVAIPAGKWMWVMCDGAGAVFAAPTYMYGDISGNAATATTAATATSATTATTATNATYATSAGNATTVTNGLYSDQSYYNPTWLTGIAPTKLTTAVPVANGGTGATTAASARTSLGVPSTAGVGATGTWNISITGTAANVSGVVAVANGGTGSSSGGAFLHYGSGSSAVVTYSTSDPTGGSAGDVHFKHEA